MIAFVIPFKPKRNSKNWQLDSNYLRNTLLSILNQTDTSFHAFVVIHEMPDEAISDKKVTYLKVPFEYSDINEIQDRQEQLKGNTYWTERDVEYLFDQGRKQMYGAKIAKQLKFDFVMSIDADDLISNKLVNYINKHRNENVKGWFVNKGYYYLVEKDVYLKQPYAMNLLNGSTYIIHRDLIPDNQIEMTVKSTNFFSNHPYLITRIKEQYGYEIQRIPFYAVIYVVSNLNWWTTTKKVKDENIRQKIKYVLRRVIFKRKLFKNFYLERQ